MDREKVTEKIQTIASRVDSPIHVPFESEYEGFPLSEFFTITEIYLFGSSLYKKNPRDIDLVVIHHSSKLQSECFRLLSKELRNQPHSYYLDRKWSFDYFLKRNLKRRMKRIDIHFEESLEETLLTPKSYVLVWSRGRPNVRENLRKFWSDQKERILPKELTHLRKELKEYTTSYGILRKLANALSRLASFEEERDAMARELARYSFYKREIPELEEFLERQRELAFFRMSEEALSLLGRVIFFLRFKDNVGRIRDSRRCRECEGRAIRKIVKILENGYQLECGHLWTKTGQSEKAESRPDEEARDQK